MRWVTRDFVHLERVATPWLIRRFVDREAEFIFIGWAPDAKWPDDAIPYAIPGVELSPHDKDGTVFRRVMNKYGLKDPALDMIDNVVMGAVRVIMQDEKPGPDDLHGQMARGLIAISEGVMLLQPSDAAVIEASLPVYDALYAFFRAELLRREPHDPKVDPDRPMTQTMYVHHMAQFLRGISPAR